MCAQTCEWLYIQWMVLLSKTDVGAKGAGPRESRESNMNLSGGEEKDLA